MKSQTRAGLMGPLALALAIVVAGVSLHCASAQVSLFKHTDLQQPSQKLVDRYVCLGQEEAAHLYLDDPIFAWIGPNKQAYMIEALALKFRGACPCAGKSCEEKAAARGDTRPPVSAPPSN